MGRVIRLLTLLLSVSLSFAIGFQDYQPTVAPLLTAEWGQLSPWNSYCPDNAPTGCVSVSMAQVMYYYQMPVKGYGEGYNGYIRWSEMHPTEPTDAAAELLYLVGRSIGANYGEHSTSTNIGEIPYNAYETWNYQFGQDNVFRNAYSDAEWHTLLQGELDDGHPLIYGGRGTGAHNFVIDGYDKVPGGAPEYHVNWGAEGRWNGWFTLDDLTPGPFDFTDNQHMLLKFYPREKCLIIPPDLQEGFVYTHAPFYWYPIGDHYTLQVAKFPTFRTLIVRRTGLHHNVAFANLEAGTTYYWRVYIYGGEYEGWSRTHKFTTRAE